MRRALLLVMTAGLCAVAPFASAAPSSGLASEDLESDATTVISCNTSSGVLTYSGSGNATGSYPGTFTEQGTITFDPATFIVQNVSISFTISSPAGDLTGAKFLALPEAYELHQTGTWTVGCNFAGPDTILSFGGTACYAATLADGTSLVGPTYVSGTRFAEPPTVNHFGEQFFAYAGSGTGYDSIFSADDCPPPPPIGAKPGKGCGDANHVHEREGECKKPAR